MLVKAGVTAFGFADGPPKSAAQISKLSAKIRFGIPVPPLLKLREAIFWAENLRFGKSQGQNRVLSNLKQPSLLGYPSFLQCRASPGYAKIPVPTYCASFSDVRRAFLRDDKAA